MSFKWYNTSVHTLHKQDPGPSSQHQSHGLLNTIDCVFLMNTPGAIGCIVLGVVLVGMGIFVG